MDTPTMPPTWHEHPPAGERRRAPHEGPHATVLLAGEETGGRFALIESAEVRGAGPPCHLHHWEDETLYVLDGEITVYLDGYVMYAVVGDAVVLPHGVEHTFVVRSQRARLLTILTPPGFEGFYRELGAADGADTATIERLVTTAARYGCEITGPAPYTVGRQEEVCQDQALARLRNTGPTPANS